MLPSDHFVRFYNEVFKFLEQRNDLEAFYREISRHQEIHCLELLKTRGVRGLYEYYVHIRKEENCDMTLNLSEHEFSFVMHRCPSLSKAMDNDAGPCSLYCMHCPGWILPLYAKAGLYCIYDVMELDRPHCAEWVLDDLERARRRYREIQAERPSAHLLVNFEP